MVFITNISKLVYHEIIIIKTKILSQFIYKLTIKRKITAILIIWYKHYIKNKFFFCFKNRFIVLFLGFSN